MTNSQKNKMIDDITFHDDRRLANLMKSEPSMRSIEDWSNITVKNMFDSISSDKNGELADTE